ncbi:MAG TPA: toll/interleukin-1 receptor domain-containing protein [Bryobacteraceae bacterium]|nr:toll/interleukin-1 receptor domain-containing protein [Bryobacteraceae bacterium]
MSKADSNLSRRVAQILRHALEKGTEIEIDGLGTFLPGRAQGFRFVAQTKPRVFIAYVEEDLAVAKKLYAAFEQHGFRPWLDRKKLLPGQNWPRAIETAIQTSNFFVACFSQRSICKRGSFHSELRFALNCAEQVPLDEIYFIPLRLDPCNIPRNIARKIQYVDLFPDWREGVAKLVGVMKKQEENRKRKNLPLAG